MRPSTWVHSKIKPAWEGGFPRYLTSTSGGKADSAAAICCVCMEGKTKTSPSPADSCRDRSSGGLKLLMNRVSGRKPFADRPHSSRMNVRMRSCDDGTGDMALPVFLVRGLPGKMHLGSILGGGGGFFSCVVVILVTSRSPHYSHVFQVWKFPFFLKVNSWHEMFLYCFPGF